MTLDELKELIPELDWESRSFGFRGTRNGNFVANVSNSGVKKCVVRSDLGWISLEELKRMIKLEAFE